MLGGNLDWSLIWIGALIGAAVILVDEILIRTGKYSLPPLAVGMGIYLPMSLTLTIPFGALIGWSYNRWAARQPDPNFAERMGVLAATGLIVGESLWGVAFAFIAYARGSATPLALVGTNAYAAPVGAVVFVTALGWLYWRTRKAASDAPLAAP